MYCETLFFQLPSMVLKAWSIDANISNKFYFSLVNKGQVYNILQMLRITCTHTHTHWMKCGNVNGRTATASRQYRLVTHPYTRERMLLFISHPKIYTCNEIYLRNFKYKICYRIFVPSYFFFFFINFMKNFHIWIRSPLSQIFPISSTPSEINFRSWKIFNNY